jgi:hypothetical protein
VKKFTITDDARIIGFQQHIVFAPLSPVEIQLHRLRLSIEEDVDSSHETLKHVITYNASLRVDFGWSFESSHHFDTIMSECVKEVIPKFNIATGLMTTDLTCCWIGFVPHNSYDTEVYKDLSQYKLILYNNELIDFQIDIITFIVNHPIFLQHAILRDERYRFDYFKRLRKNRSGLAEAYQYYMNATHEIPRWSGIPRDIIEEQIGCHFLYEPDLFFELVSFSKLKGEIYE